MRIYHDSAFQLHSIPCLDFIILIKDLKEIKPKELWTKSIVVCHFFLFPEKKFIFFISAIFKEADTV